jgi:hypothetical protein
MICAGRHQREWFVHKREITTSFGRGEWSDNSAAWSRTATTVAFRFFSSTAKELTASFAFHIGEAVIPNILGRWTTGH